MGNIDKNLISIVVPVYNAEAFIRATIATVQAQTYDEWELLLVDDCSSDSSCELIQLEINKDNRIKLIHQEANQGAANARNRGVLEAQGRYVCFLDADDIWNADKLEKQLKYMNEKSAGFCFSGYEFADEFGNGLGKIVQVPEKITYEQALKNTTIFTSTVMIDRNIVADEDIFMPDIPSEDTATWWKILKNYGTGYGLNENLVKYRRSTNTLSSNKLVAIKRIWNLYRKQEKLPLIKSLYCMFFWAFRAVARRV